MIWILLVLALTLLSPRATAGPEPLRVGVWHFNALVTMLLKEGADRGLYGREGVALRFEIVRRDADMVAGLRGGSLDVVPLALASGLPHAIAAGAPLRSIFVLTQYPDVFLVSRRSSLAELRGGRIGAAGPYTVTDKVLAEQLQARGIAATLVPFDVSAPRIAALKSGAVDAAVVSLFFAVKLQGEGYNVLLAPQDLRAVPVFGLAVRAEDVQAPWIRGLVRGTTAALRWYREQPDQAQAMVAKYGELTPEQAETAYRLSLPMLSHRGLVEASKIEAALRLMGLALHEDDIFNFQAAREGAP